MEPLTLIGILFAAGALWAFFAIAAEMVEGDLHGLDESLLLALRMPGDTANPIGGPHIEAAMRDLTALGGVTVLALITLLVLIFLVLRRERASAVFLSIAVLGGVSLSQLAKAGFARPRPDLVPHGVEVMSASFPSGHSMMAAVTYLTLAVMLARREKRSRIRVFYILSAVFLTMLVGISRVFLGVHWPSDVLAGWTLGAAWALVIWTVARLLARHGQIEPDAREKEQSPAISG